MSSGVTGLAAALPEPAIAPALPEPAIAEPEPAFALPISEPVVGPPVPSSGFFFLHPNPTTATSAATSIIFFIKSLFSSAPCLNPVHDDCNLSDHASHQTKSRREKTRREAHRRGPSDARPHLARSSGAARHVRGH